MPSPELLPPPRIVPVAWLREMPWKTMPVVMLVWLGASALVSVVALPFQLILHSLPLAQWLFPLVFGTAILAFCGPLLVRGYRTIQQRNELLRSGVCCAGKVLSINPAGALWFNRLLKNLLP